MKQNVDIRSKAFYFISIVTFFVSIMCVIGNVITHYPMSANIKWFYLMIVSIMSLIGHKSVYEFHLQVFHTLSIILIVLPVGWINGGRGNSNSTAYLFLIMVGITLLYENRLRKLLLLILAATVGILFYVEYKYPELMKIYSYEMLFRDRLIQVPITLFGGFLILSLYANTYIREREKLNEYSIQLKEANEKLEYLANKDVLTDINNRRAFDIKLEEIINCHEQFEKEIYVILFDVDLFKEINDTYGHSTGDRVLREVANGLKKLLNTEALFSRWGGDEFAIIFYGSKEEVINTVTGLNKLLKSITIERKDKVTVSIGITKILTTDTMNKVFKRVDEGLYKSKSEGRNKYSII
ncbi:MAG: diguanylate cyclase [Anaerocolumna sp.]|nr:diguanylate cyclase [Anaerocolumna sp.]